MAIRIVDAAPKEYHARCGKCGCHFTYELKDLAMNYRAYAEGVYCPKCSEWHRHSAPPREEGGEKR